MNQELRVEFKMAASNRRPVPKPKPTPEAAVERKRQDRVARRARNLALAYYIDGLVRSGEIADLADVARMCGVSRARVSKVVSLLGMAGIDQLKAIEQANGQP
ncbi:MAG: hypothetical protein IPM94_11510 [bacterium]|nr:hypothetical protein [bacterium]